MGEPKARANPHERAAIPLDRPGTVRCTQRLRITPPASNVPSLPEQDRVQHIKIRTASVFETWSGSELKAEVVVAVVTVIAVVSATRFLTFEVVNDLRIAIKDRMCA